MKQNRFEWTDVVVTFDPWQLGKRVFTGAISLSDDGPDARMNSVLVHVEITQLL